MYPYQLSFHGIRDFMPTKIKFGNENEHVLTGGINGSGKSTIVYAMAMALASEDIDIWSLRSKNIDRSKPWNSSVSVIFHNPPGLYQKEAPEYVEFRVDITANNLERYNIKYRLNGGIHHERLELLKSFTCRRDAFEYFKNSFNIDVDGYFMFCYQGSITSFADCSDIDRFKRVSKMFGIEVYEEVWHDAQAQLSNAQRELQYAKDQQNVHNNKLRILETSYNELLTRNKNRDKAIAGIVKITEMCNKFFDEKILKLMNDIQITKDELNKTTKEVDTLEIEIKKASLKINNLNSALSNIKSNRLLQNNKLNDRQEKYDALKKEYSELERELIDIKDKIRTVRPENDLLILQGQLVIQIDTLKINISNIETEIESLTEKKEQLIRKRGWIDGEIEKYEEKYKKNIEQLKNLSEYISLKTDYDDTEDLIKGLDRSIFNNNNKLEEIKKKLEELSRRKSVLLNEQYDIIKRFKDLNIECAAFGEVFEIKDEAKRKEIEDLIAPIKHTVFCSNNPTNIVSKEGAFYIVNTSLYMKNNHDSEFFKYIKISEEKKEELSKEFITGVLAWVSNIGIEKEVSKYEGLYIVNGKLLDGSGIRGPVKNEYVIGKHALEYLKDKLNQDAEMLNKRINIDKEDLKKYNIDLKNIYVDMNERKRIDEENPVLEKDLQVNKEKSEEYYVEINNLISVLKGKSSEKTKYEEEKILKEKELKDVFEEIDTHKKFKELAGKFSSLEELKNNIRIVEDEVTDIKNTLNKYKDQYTNIDQELKMVTSEVDLMNSNLNSTKDLCSKLSQTSDDLNLKLLDVQSNQDEIKKKEQSLIIEYSNSYYTAVSLIMVKDLDIDTSKIQEPYIKRKLKDFEELLSETKNKSVDEDAEINYNLFLKEYNSSAKQLSESEIRFNELKEKEEKHSDDLKKMVNSRFMNTNKLFKEYMNMLGMEGEIKNILPNTSKINDSYKWEIHAATKEGHSLDKVKPDFGKGKKGEGVSGGERAVVSLMFALALLSQIDIKPPFYVLDEFDSALDEGRKHKVFDIFNKVLNRKMIIVSPKMHGKEYLDRFKVFHCVISNTNIEKGREISQIYTISRKEYEKVELED